MTTFLKLMSISFLILINGSYKHCITIKLILVRECIVCHYSFFNHGFEFQRSVWNGSHDLTILCLNISDIAIITVKGVEFRCIIHEIRKSKAIQLLENTGLDNFGYIKNVCQ